MKQITKRQQEILNFIKDFIETRGYPPTYQEIGDHFSMSAMSAKSHIVLIEKKGFIDMQQGKPRSIQLKVTLHEALGDSTDGKIRKGDYVYMRGKTVTGITREVK